MASRTSSMSRLPLALQIDLRPDCAEIQDAMVGITGGRSVPRVFIDGKFIGETVVVVTGGSLPGQRAIYGHAWMGPPRGLSSLAGGPPCPPSADTID